MSQDPQFGTETPNEIGLKEIEETIRSVADGEGYVLKLYVSGSSPRSTRAITNIKHICEEHLSGRYELQIVDLYQQPHMAQSHNVIAAPTLIKSQPEPIRRVIGDLSDQDKVLITLDIHHADLNADA